MSVKVSKLDPMGRCHYCNRVTYPPGSHPAIYDPNCMGTRDHVNPRRLACVEDQLKEEVVHACHECNSIKGDSPYDVFVFWMQHRDKLAGKKMRNDEFRDFIFALTLTGFHAAYNMAVHERCRHDPAPRGAGGRFTVRSLRAHQRAERARA